MSGTPGRDETVDPPHEESISQSDRLRAKRARARRVLLVAFVIILVALGLYGVWPWLLPAFIVEGPMVQMARERELTLVWFMSRPVHDGLAVRLGDQGRVFAVESDGRRSRAALTGLEPGQAYPYKILLGRRTLADEELRTNKPAREPFTFVVFGDSGRGTQEQYMLAGQMTAADPDFLLHTGDLVYGRGERHKYYERFFSPYRELLRQVNFWPSLGNHDVVEPHYGQPYLDVFELPQNGPEGEQPERNYWFDYASARIAIVDSNIDEAALRDHVAPWLRDVLGEADAVWKFVVFHHPPYTGGHYEPDERIQRTLVPVFESAGVDVVFNGHDHMFQRSHPIRDGEIAQDGGGVVYVITGAGGARIYEALPPEQRPAYVAALNDEIHSFTHASVSGNELVLEQIALGGDVLDHWVLTKQPASRAVP